MKFLHLLGSFDLDIDLVSEVIGECQLNWWIFVVAAVLILLLGKNIQIIFLMLANPISAQTIDIAGMNSRHDMAYIHSIEKSIIKTPLLYILVFLYWYLLSVFCRVLFLMVSIAYVVGSRPAFSWNKMTNETTRAVDPIRKSSYSENQLFA